MWRLAMCVSLTMACGVDGTGTGTGTGTGDGTGDGDGTGTGTGDGTVDGTVDGSGPGPEPGGLVRVTGAVQKGPFILGTTVGMSPLTAEGSPVGSYFETASRNDLGEFEVDAVPAGATALAADGFFFDELRGGLSQAPLTLRALHNAKDGGPPVHIHPWTHVAEPRARALLAEGLAVEDALAMAEAEVVVALGIGPPGLALAGPAGQASVTGVDILDNAYAFAVGVVFARAAATSDPDAPEAALQLALNTAGAALADGGPLPEALAGQLAAAEAALDAAAVQVALDARLAELGLPPGPDIRRALDQDFDGVANFDDNCPLDDNPGQADVDNDGLGDVCDVCDGSDGDGDGDGIQDGCDNCPATANPLMPIPNDQNGAIWQPNADGDGLGDACDSCPQISGLGAVPGENCCDPREKECTARYPGDLSPYLCFPEPSGLRFACFRRGFTSCTSPYRGNCNNCYEDEPCLPAGGLVPANSCQPWECKGHLRSKWCVVGQDAPCEAQHACLSWWKPGEAPAGLEDLGVCAAVAGTCAGKAGRECAKWAPLEG